MPKKGKKTGTQKKDFIAKALSSKEARKALFASLTEPIKRSLKYTATGTRMLKSRKMP